MEIMKLMLPSVVNVLIGFFVFLAVCSIVFPASTVEKRFSTTQRFGAEYLPFLIAAETNPKVKQLLSQAPRIPFPSDSRAVQAELDDIVLKQTALTPARLQQIKRQVSGDAPFIEMGATSTDINEISPFYNDVLSPVIMKLKQEYDRVRPQYLDARIKPVIQTPNHPAYPSGHATQAYAIALWMAHKYPHRRDDLLRIAENIAINREYAGVHYASDRMYGRRLAEYLVSQSTTT